MEDGLANCSLCRFKSKEAGGDGRCYLLRNKAWKTYQKMFLLPYHNCGQFRKQRDEPEAEQTERMF